MLSECEPKENQNEKYRCGRFNLTQADRLASGGTTGYSIGDIEKEKVWTVGEKQGKVGEKHSIR